MTTATRDKKNEYQKYVKQKGNPQKNMHPINKNQVLATLIFIYVHIFMQQIFSNQENYYKI